ADRDRGRPSTRPSLEESVLRHVLGDIDLVTLVGLFDLGRVTLLLGPLLEQIRPRLLWSGDFVLAIGHHFLDGGQPFLVSGRGLSCKGEPGGQQTTKDDCIQCLHSLICSPLGVVSSRPPRFVLTFGSFHATNPATVNLVKNASLFTTKWRDLSGLFV